MTGSAAAQEFAPITNYLNLTRPSVYRVKGKSMRIINSLRYFLIIATMATALTQLSFATGGSAVSTALQSVCAAIRLIVGVLVIVLLAVGAVLYAISHVLPAAGNIKGNLQGWSLNMIVGAIVALVIYFLAPWIASQIITTGAGTSGVTAITAC